MQSFPSALTLSKLISENSGVLKSVFWEKYHVPQSSAVRTNQDTLLKRFNTAPGTEEALNKAAINCFTSLSFPPTKSIKPSHGYESLNVTFYKTYIHSKQLLEAKYCHCQEKYFLIKTDRDSR